MAISNQTKVVTLTTEYLNLPDTRGISPYGYWFYYIPANGGNTALGAKIKPYQWGSPLPLAGGASEITIDGTMPLIVSPWNGVNVSYHGSCITWVGQGINDITGQQETDAYFFAHLGALAASDDAFYWDRLYLPAGGSEWAYYQYHKHLPTFYVTYENGRQVQSGDTYIDPADPAYGYLISSRVRVSGVNYTSVLARIHTPSVGGAHNSHNDTTLPTAGALNYMACGIVRGIGQRYHAFYISASGAQWTVYNRTYIDSAASFTAQVTLGVYDLADPTFNPSSNQQYDYPIRASNGCNFGARIYIPVILNNATTGFDLEIWSFNSLDTIAGGSLIRQVIAQQLTTRPDCYIIPYGTEKIYTVYTDTINGGIRLFSYDGTTWTNEGTVLTNSVANPVRVHGFEFNTTDFKFYMLLSGTTSGGGSTYTGPGMYTFTLTDPFLGYRHLDYTASSNSFTVKAPLATGYVKYNVTEAFLSRINAQEPQAIPSGTEILDYGSAGQTFYNRVSSGFGGKDYYYHSITLSDGRRFAAGQVVDNPNNLGVGGDFLFSMYDSNLGTGRHFAWGGAGADFFTGCWEDKDAKRIYLTGYSKSALVPKGDVLIHGWARSLTDGGNAIEYRDLTIDSNGNSYCVGSHVSGLLLVTKYDKNYDLVWQKAIGDGTPADIGVGIAVDNSGNIYISGNTTDAGAGSTDALLIKLDSNGNILFAKVYGSASAESANSIAIIKKSGTQYVVMAVVSGTSTTFLITDTSGNIVEQFSYTNLIVNRVRPIQSNDNAGRYLFAGDDGGGTTAAKFGMCQILSSGTHMQWVRTYSGAQAYDAKDIVNTDQAVAGNNAGFVICGTKGTTDSFVLKVSVNESAGPSYTISKSWAKTMVIGSGAQHADCGFMSLTASPYTDTTRYVYVVGCTDISNIAAMGMEEGLITSWAASDGTLQWQNVFGHDMEEMFYAVAPDTTGLNLVSVGWSASHAAASAGVIFRCPKLGYSTGLYTYEDMGTMPYYYVNSALVTSNNTDTLNTISTPSNTTGTLVAASYTATIADTPYTNNNFNGSFGPAGLFNFILGYIDLELYQELLNNVDYQEFELGGCVNDEIYYLSAWTLVGKIWEAGTVGDGSADDGNMFGYDIIKHSTNGLVYAIGQTSGDISQTNLGASGVYDYLLVVFDPVTEMFEWYQNGTLYDEETYALTELANGKVAYCGRTSGPLGSPNLGGYDIFLGIYDPATETSTYYSTGTGLDDKGMNLHDIGNNTLIIAFSTYGTMGTDPNVGSEDIGFIKFNYSTGTWGTSYQTGTTTSEIFEQNGKPSALIGNDRAAITCSSQGVFADDAITYGYLDICLAILDLTTGTWVKYQVGSTANEVSSSCTSSGGQLLIGGNSGGSFDSDIDAIFVEFDATPGVVGRTSSLN